MKIINSENQLQKHNIFKDYKETILIESVSFEDGTSLLFHTDSDIILKNTNFGEKSLFIENKGTGMIVIYGNSKKELDRFAKTRIEANSVLIEQVDITFKEYQEENFKINALKVNVLDSRIRESKNLKHSYTKTMSNKRKVLNNSSEEKPIFMSVMAQSLCMNRSSMNHHIYYKSFNEGEENLLSVIETKAQLSLCDYADPIDYFFALSSDVTFMNGSNHPFKKTELNNSAIAMKNGSLIFEDLYLKEGSNISTSSKHSMCIIRDLKLDEDSEVFSMEKNPNIIVGNYVYDEISYLQNEKRRLLETLRNVEEKQKTLTK